jgi:hypothetical protein
LQFVGCYSTADFAQSRAALAEINASLRDGEDAKSPDDVGYHSPTWRFIS